MSGAIVTLVAALFLCLTSFSAFAAVEDIESGDNFFKFRLKFEKGYSFIKNFPLNNSYVVSIDTIEDVNVEKELWDSPIKRITTQVEGTRKRIIFEFNEKSQVPEIISNEKELSIVFKFDAAPIEKKAVSSQAYGTMVMGLIVTIILILLIYWLMKTFFKKKVFSDIPGTGRLLGKVDLDLRKSIYFYELSEKIYIFGVTDVNMNLLDKITDEDEINIIKAGFSRKKDFSSYMNFFTKGSELKGDINVSKDIIKEKKESIKKH